MKKFEIVKSFFIALLLIYQIPCQAVEMFLSEKVQPSGLTPAAGFRLGKIVEKKDYLSYAVKKFDSNVISFKSVEQLQEKYPNFEFEIPGGERMRALLRGGTVQPNGVHTWTGRIEGDLHSMAIITVHDENMTGQIHAFGKTLTIKPIEKNMIVMRVHNPNTIFPQTEDNLVIDLNGKSDIDKKYRRLHQQRAQYEARSKPNNISVSGDPIKTASYEYEDDGTVIDFYGFYTDDALAASSSIVTEITNDVEYTNVALDQSCAETSLRLVGTSKLDFDEHFDSEKYLTDLSTPNDGNYDSIFTNLNSTGADMASLWVESYMGSASNDAPVGSVAGLAITSLPYPGFFTTFSTKVRSSPAAVLAHEIGHNFTVEHDRFQCPKIKLKRNYAQETGFGFVNLNEKVRDLMSYAKECGAHKIGCDWIHYYSNPRILINGRPFGISNQADAVTQINKNRQYISRIRPAKSAPSKPSFMRCAETRASSMKLDKCFIATAAYGSFLNGHVTTFRVFRDRFLAQSAWGKSAIELYYQISPRISDWIKGSEFLKFFVRIILSTILIVLQFPKFVFAAIVILILILSRRKIQLNEKKNVIGVSKSRLRGKSASMNRIFFFFFSCFLLFVPSVTYSSFNQASIFSGVVENPAALIGRREKRQLATILRSEKNSYESSAAVATTATEKNSPSVDLISLGQGFGFSLHALPKSSQTNEWIKSADITDSWITEKTFYKVNFATSFFSTAALGLGFKQQTDTIQQSASNDTGTWGVRETKRITQTQSGTLGLKKIFSEQFSFSGTFEYGQSIATDTAKLTFSKGALSAGVVGDEYSILQKVDLTLILAPPSYGYEAAPIGSSYQLGQRAVLVETEFQIPIGILIDKVLLGASIETATLTGVNGSGDSAKKNATTFKAGVAIMNNFLVAQLQSASQTVDYGIMKDKNNITSLGVALVF